MDRSFRQKINKETQALNNTIDQIDLMDVYGAIHPKVAEYTFFLGVQRTFSWIYHIFGQKSGVGKFNEIVTISNIFSDHNTMRLEINYKKQKC